MENTKEHFKGKVVFMGLDPHKKTWNLTARSERLHIKQALSWPDR